MACWNRRRRRFRCLQRVIIREAKAAAVAKQHFGCVFERYVCDSLPSMRPSTPSLRPSSLLLLPLLLLLLLLHSIASPNTSPSPPPIWIQSLLLQRCATLAFETPYRDATSNPIACNECLQARMSIYRHLHNHAGHAPLTCDLPLAVLARCPADGMSCGRIFFAIGSGARASAASYASAAVAVLAHR